jgi:diamine N-acetyltransferase
MENLILKKAITDDSQLIADIAYKSWKSHYPGIISESQINYMLELMYATELLKKHIESQTEVFYLIQIEETTVGFISTSKRSNDLYIQKFYLLPEYSGKGIGENAFRKLILLLNADNIRLTVNRQNYKSINFYFKLGFIIEKVADFDIGNGFVMYDFVMYWVNS